MKTIDSIQTFESIVTTHNVVVVIFSSDVCPDCMYLETFIGRIEEKYPSLVFGLIKRDVLPEVFTHYNIYGVPSLYVYKNGEIIGQYVDKKRKTFEQVDRFLSQTLSLKGER